MIKIKWSHEWLYDSNLHFDTWIQYIYNFSCCCFRWNCYWPGKMVCPLPELYFSCLMTRQYSAIFFNPLVKHNNFLMHFISLNSCGDSSHRIGQWKAKVLLNSQNNCFLSEMAFTNKSCVVVLNSVSVWDVHNVGAMTNIWISNLYILSN